MNGQVGNVIVALQPLAPIHNRKSAGQPSISAPKRREKSADQAPPKISQNHYRHIHEQRDFTFENLSMAGETDFVDYDNFGIEL